MPPRSLISVFVVHSLENEFRERLRTHKAFKIDQIIGIYFPYSTQSYVRDIYSTRHLQDMFL